jgi:acetyl-CoA C-acetyltransferase
MKKTVILSAVRTPIGSFMGSLSSMPATALGSIAIKAALNKSTVLPSDVDQVIMGQVLQGGAGQAPARQAAILAGLPEHVPCTTVNKVCGSGLKAVMMAASDIATGESSTVIAGGMESMSNAPYILPQARAGFRMGNNVAVDLMINDGLFDPYNKLSMGIFGDRTALEYKFSRAEQDEYAKSSYQRAIDAQKNGYFKDEMVSIEIKSKLGSTIIDKDEEPTRFQPEKFATLRPAFSEDGTVTAANASKVSDGASALVLMEEQKAKEKNLKPVGRIIASATFAQNPAWFTTAPVTAIKKALKLANMKPDDIDLYEINEAFSVVSMYAMKELSLKRDQVNIFGGAISLGHPIGCSGARLLTTLLNALKLQNKSLGCVSLCIGGGEAVAMIVERI